MHTPTFLKAKWRYLIMANYPIATEAIVMDVLGRTVWTGTLQRSTRIDLSAAGHGVYILKATGAAPLRLVVE